MARWRIQALLQAILRKQGFSELIEITASFLYRDQYASLECNFTSGAKDFSSLLGLISITKS